MKNYSWPFRTFPSAKEILKEEEEMTPEKRHQQAERITKALEDVQMEEHELPRFLKLWILDLSYDRGAICEAEKLIRRARGWKER